MYIFNINARIPRHIRHAHKHSNIYTKTKSERERWKNRALKSHDRLNQWQKLYILCHVESTIKKHQKKKNTTQNRRKKKKKNAQREHNKKKSTRIQGNTMKIFNYVIFKMVIYPFQLKYSFVWPGWPCILSACVRHVSRAVVAVFADSSLRVYKS